jgi:glycosyltransferase involved in cell wall biosynthesis
MKISYISNSQIPSKTANSIHVMKMCQAFSRNGHDVTLLAPDNIDDYMDKEYDTYQYYGVSDCFDIVKQPWLKVKGRGYIYAILAAFWAKKNRTDLVYGRNLFGCLISSLLGIPVIFESHAPDWKRSRISKMLFKQMINKKKLIKIVVITKSLKKDLIENYPEKNVRVQVSPDGADPISHQGSDIKLSDMGGKLNVGYVGHLYPGKGMEIINCLVRNCSNYNFHIIGGHDQDVMRWRERLSDCVNVEFYGHVPHSMAEEYVVKMDVVLLPNQPVVSVTEKDEIGKWTSPLKMFEYMAAGKPIIASDIPVLREILRNNINSILCKHDKIDEWVAALDSLCENKALAKMIATNAKKEFLTKYTWAARAKRVIE